MQLVLCSGVVRLALGMGPIATVLDYLATDLSIISHSRTHDD